MSSNLRELGKFVRESNAIEGIHRGPTLGEVDAFGEWLELEGIKVSDVEELVGVFQPGAKLRSKDGMNVSIGNHNPPPGGPDIPYKLDEILSDTEKNTWGAYGMHHRYETLHPFMDGNGRSGRALWAWQMVHHNIWPKLELGFLHAFYYQSLSAGR